MLEICKYVYSRYSFSSSPKTKNIFPYFETLWGENSHMAPEPVTGNLAAFPRDIEFHSTSPS